jgi:hypothetical protein
MMADAKELEVAVACQFARADFERSPRHDITRVPWWAVSSR